MTSYQEARVALPNTQLKKIKTAQQKVRQE